MSTVTNTGFSMATITKRTLSAGETAKVLGISAPTVYQWARENKLPCIHNGDRVLFPAKAIYHLADYGTLPTSSLQLDIKEIAREVVREMIRLDMDTKRAQLDALTDSDTIDVSRRRRAG